MPNELETNIDVLGCGGTSQRREQNLMTAYIAEAQPPRLEPFRWKLTTFAATDVGKKRARNEDRFVCDETLQLYGVADGVGGLPAGADAAELAVTSLRRRVAAADAALDLTAITRELNSEVADAGTRLSPHAGIATTLTWGVFRGDALHLAHVGDSRCYCLRNGGLEALSSDHSVENEARQRRARGEVAFFSARDRNAITRCIGQPNALEVDQLVRPVQPGDRYLFCTDGICRAMGNADIKEILAWVLPPELIVGGLIDHANARGGWDNATAVLVVIGSAATPCT